MIIDQHTINTLRTLAQQCEDADNHAHIQPAMLLALIGAYEERDELATDYDTEHHHRQAVERDRDALADKVALLKSKLRDIANPVAMMQREARETGGFLDGQLAIAMANDANYLRELARQTEAEH